MIPDEGVVCGKACSDLDVACMLNKTKSVSWQFIALPTIKLVNKPLVILNIQTKGYSVYPNLRLTITGGNRDQAYDVVTEGDAGNDLGPDTELGERDMIWIDA